MGDEAMIQRGYVKIRKMRNWRNLGGLEYPVGLFQIFFLCSPVMGWSGQTYLTTWQRVFGVQIVISTL